MADKSSQLVLTALSQAAAAAAPVPLHGGKASPGLFPATAAGKQAAQRCKDEGYLQVVSDHAAPPANLAGPATAVKKKTRAAQELCAITDKGLTHLLSQVSPRQVLEDFVRVLEARQALIGEMAEAAREMQAGVEALRGHVEQVLQHVRRAENAPHRPASSGGMNALFHGFLSENGSPALNGHAAPPAPDAALLAQLAHWQSSGASEDCPLPELYRQTQAQVAGLTIGQFHDALRQLHDAQRIYLHPWTGPLYDIPEPPYALLVGHLVAYYASFRK